MVRNCHQSTVAPIWHPGITVSRFGPHEGGASREPHIGHLGWLSKRDGEKFLTGVHTPFPLASQADRRVSGPGGDGGPAGGPSEPGRRLRWPPKRKAAGG